MIRNIIFDLGNVLVNFRFSEFFDKKNYPENLKAKIISDIFSSKEWCKLDNGEISVLDAINSIALKSSLEKQEIAHIFDLRTELMFPLDQNIKVLPELKKQHFRLFYLSNFQNDIFYDIKTVNNFFKYFDGGIISSDVNVSKPDIRIYNILLEKYSLVPEECFFIDDIEINVKAAEIAGMKGYVTYGSLNISKQIENALRIFLV
jgi:glucose-1-phosphatase